MEGFGLLVPKFIKYVAVQDLEKNEWRFPSAICEEYGNIIPDNCRLKLNTGYEAPITFDRSSRKFSGIRVLYEDLALEGGELLVFEYFGSSEFVVHIIGSDFAEIEYPSVVHHLQNSRPLVVTLKKVGLRFVSFVSDADSLVNEVEPPLSFLQRLPPNIGGYIQLLISNGFKINGFYNRDTLKLCGIGKLSDIIGSPVLKKVNMFLFTYDAEGILNVSAFDDNFVEIVFPLPLFSNGPDSNRPRVSASFSIVVQPFHMNKYCHGVDISSDFRNLWFMWGKKDYISVFSGNRAWKLQIKQRKKWDRAAIHDGWLRFRDDLELQVGDTCLFECVVGSYRHFSIRVIKKPN